MKDRTLKFADSRQFIGRIARSGENNTRSLAFDCSTVLTEYPAAQIIAVIQRPQGDPYTVTPDMDGTIRRITLTSYDLEFNGHLQIELRILDGEKILKSAIYTATIDDSILGEADAPGQPVRDVLDRLDAEIKQAQAVVNDIRQKLENGEFNGSDAEVTAANIEAALGYMPVKPSELAEKQDVLTGSDKQSIVKTGMTSGSAWTAAEQKAARIRMGVDKAYELIESFITDGTATSIERVQESGGTPYNFVSVKVAITSPKNLSAEQTVYAMMFCGGQGVGTYSTYMGNLDYFYRATYTWTKENGAITGIVNTPTIIYADQDKNGGDYSPMKVTPDVAIASENFTRLRLYCMNGTIPAGFLIQIYGVRA